MLARLRCECEAAMVSLGHSHLNRFESRRKFWAIEY